MDDGHFQCNGSFSLNGKRKKMAKPERMILIVKSSKCAIIQLNKGVVQERYKNTWKGIRSIEGNIPFPIQVIVTKKLDEKAHAGLRA